VAATQDHSKSLLSTHCNVTAIANVLAAIAPKHQGVSGVGSTNHLRASSQHPHHPHSGLVDRLYSLEESAADQFHHLEDRMFSMTRSNQVPVNPIPSFTTSKEATTKDIAAPRQVATTSIVVPPSSSSSSLSVGGVGMKLASEEWNKHKREGLSNENREWLLFGIPTVPRVNNEDHLIKVLTSIFDQVFILF
jgi:hypothetical protein